MDADLVDILPHTVSIRARTGGSDYAGFTFATAKTYKAYVNSEDTKLYAPDGTERISHARVYVGPEVLTDGTLGSLPSMGPDDEITLDDGTRPPIMKVNAIPDVEKPQANYVVEVFV
jgi:hypothetical protein